MNESHSAWKEKRGRKRDFTSKISSKYYQLAEKCNSLHVSISCVVRLVDFN